MACSLKYCKELKCFTLVKKKFTWEIITCCYIEKVTEFFPFRLLVSQALFWCSGQCVHWIHIALQTCSHSHLPPTRWLYTNYHIPNMKHMLMKERLKLLFELLNSLYFLIFWYRNRYFQMVNIFLASAKLTQHDHYIFHPCCLWLYV